VLWATDDYFAPKENLVRPDAPQWKEGLYTDRGKWMDGWESQRKREPGHDEAILRLGTPGRVHGIVCDTTHFKGNAPQAVALEIAQAPHTATPTDLLALPQAQNEEEYRARNGGAWLRVLPQTPIQADFPNLLPLPVAGEHATHVRLHIFPDGGVARLRVYGEVQPHPRVFWRGGSVDLAAVENGGTVVAVSDQFFGPPSNLLLPGRGVNMGDGWETRRRRTPGSDWCVIRLARRGWVERLELDTHFFKGNAPQAVLVEGLDEADLAPEQLQQRLTTPGAWVPFIEPTPLVQHHRHWLEPARPQWLTHLRVHIMPHGGVNRLRAFGYAAATPAEQARLAELEALHDAAATELLLSFNGSERWAARMLAERPFASVRKLFAKADHIWWQLDQADWLRAFAAHPRIGQSHAAATATSQSAAWSRGEQAQVQHAAAPTTARLAELNEAYYEKFGFTFIVCATGRSASQMLGMLECRLHASPHEEIETAAREQARITRLRLEKWILGQ
jgi:allantoicase